eukprot:gene32074-38787_t
MMRYASADEQGNTAAARDIRTHPEERSVRVKAKGILAELDADHDGFVNEAELLKHVISASAEHKERQFLRKAVLAMALLLLMFTFVGMGLTYAVIEATKDTTTNDNDVLISVNSGDPVQCASTDFVVINGALVPRDGESESSLRRLQSTGDSYLDASSVSALATRQVMQKRQISSTMPDSYFKELQWLEIQTVVGATLSLKITAISRVMHNKAKCGTFLKLVTSAGVLILDDVDIYYDDEVADLLSEAGFVRFTKPTTAGGTVPDTNRIPSTRRLSNIVYLDDEYVPHLMMVHDAPVRRLTSEGALTVIGFFNFIDSAPWTCSSVEKPDMPDIYSADINYLQKCLVVEGVGDICMFRNHGYETDMYGVIVLDGTRYASSIQKIYRSSSLTAVTVQHPHHPNVTEVFLHFPETNVARGFQIEPDGKVTHCSTSTMETPIMKLPDDYIFAYVGLVEGTNLRHFQISFKNSEIESNFTQSRFSTIDYYDDATTKFPELIIQSDGSLVEISNFRSGSQALSFRDANFSVSTQDFRNCLIATEAVAVPQRVEELRNLSSAESYDESEHVELIAALQAWNWSVTYPPSVGSIHSFSGDDLQYYVDLLVPTIPDPDDEGFTLYQVNSDWAHWAVFALNASKVLLFQNSSSIPSGRLGYSNVSVPNAFQLTDMHSQNLPNDIWQYVWDNEKDIIAGTVVGDGWGSYYFNINPVKDTVIFLTEFKSFKISFFLGWKKGLKLYFTMGGCSPKAICGKGKISGEMDSSEGKNSIGGEVKVYFDIYKGIIKPLRKYMRMRFPIPSIIADLLTVDLLDMSYKYQPGQAGRIDGYDVRNVHTIGATGTLTFYPLRVRFVNRVRSYDARIRSKWGNGFGDYTMTAVGQVHLPRFFGMSWNSFGSFEIIDRDWVQ